MFRKRKTAMDWKGIKDVTMSAYCERWILFGDAGFDWFLSDSAEVKATQQLLC